MKIAVATRAIAPLHGRGGLERAVADGCAALAARGHTVTVFTAIRTASEDGPQLPFAVVEVPWARFAIPRRGGVFDRAIHYGPFVQRLTDAVAATGERYDVAIGHGAAAAAFLPLRRAGHLPHLLLNPHGMEEFVAPPLKRAFLRGQRALVRHAAAAADRVIATDTALVPMVRRALSVPAERVAVVPNGIDLAAIDARTPPPVPASPLPTLVSVGRIEANKGLDLLAIALGECRSALPDGWHWFHVGDGAGRQTVERAIAAAGIAAHATLCGALTDAEMHALLARATLFVHPARYEGSSLVTLEAMAHRLPVIATRVGGIPDKVVPGETGWLVPPDAPQMLSAAIREACALPDATLRAMGACGRKRVEAHFSLDHTTDVLLALIASLA